MAEEQDRGSLSAQNQTLQREVDDLRTMLSVMKENVELHRELRSFTLANESAGNLGQAVSFYNDGDPVKTAGAQWLDSVDESQFSRGLLKKPYRTSSPLSLQTEKLPLHTSQHPDRESSHRGTDPERLVGEIAFQLDRRILSHVFRDQSRLYGFTVVNIPDKIIQVSTHPLTGKVDEAYRRDLNNRYVKLMDHLRSLGYSMTLHPPFTEFIVNTYGIMKQRLDSDTARQLGYSDPDVLQRAIVGSAPSGLLKDLLVLFSCLCYMARLDGKPLLLW
ncbi:speriolin-like protein [Salminus brasiliensis]|uniref:speriolin-like protein n=1 Tax=Salminus brasiliensis TaxID=930266 RepID=UPI003B83297E